MIRKKLHFVLLLGALPFCKIATAQLYIDNATFIIQTGATVTVQGDVTSNVDIQGAGKVLLGGTANQNVNMNGFSIPNLEVNNGANATLLGNAKVATDLTFTAGKIQLGAYNLTVNNVVNATNAKYVVTNGAGKLIKTALGTTAFTYPVGNTTGTYNPVTISNSGTADDIAVRSLASALTGGLTGTAFTKEAVDASWDITEAVAGNSNLSITASWAGTDELPGFNRAKGGLSYYITTPSNNAGWDMLNTQLGAATGSNPYSYTRTGVTSLGTFAVGFRPVLSPLLVNMKVFLQGSYNSTLNAMTEVLRTSNLIPTTEPYSGITGFVHSGSGGGETTTTAIVGSGAPATGTNVVDWVFVQLHRSSDGAVVSTKSVLLQEDGNLVETDGVSPVNFSGNAAGSYYVSVRHRNHLGMRSLNTIALAKTTAPASPVNFTNDLSQVYIGSVTNPAGPTLKAGVYGLYGGNTVVDKTTRASGPAAINDATKLIGLIGSAPLLSNVYSLGDINLDGVVRSTGPAAINDYTKLIGIIGSLPLITQPTF